MNRKLLGKLFIAVTLIVMVISNVSYAINIDKITFKKSLMHLFASDLKLKTESTGEGFSGSSSIGYDAPAEITITDDKVLLKETGEVDGEQKEFAMELNYAIEDNIVKFSMESDINKYLDVAGEDTNPALAMFALIMMHSSSMSVSYLTVADYLNVDLNTALTYFDQLANAEAQKNAGTSDDESDEYDDTVTTPLFTRNLYYNNVTGIIKSSIEVNVDEVEKITEASLDGTVKSTVEFVNEYKEQAPGNNNENVNNEVNNTVNNAVNNTVNNTANNTVNNTNTNTNKTNNTVNNTANNVVNNTNTNSNKANNVVNNAPNNNTIIIRDDTTTNKIIPAAGESSIYYFLIALTIASIYAYVKLKQYDDVK